LKTAVAFGLTTSAIWGEEKKRKDLDTSRGEIVDHLASLPWRRSPYLEKSLFYAGGIINIEKEKRQ